jgi:outer membrane protein assembly factor BamD (BamD/ComL family)
VQHKATGQHDVAARVASVASSIQTISIAVALFGSIASAPVQCARDPAPESAIEDEPGEALFGLAEQFREQGNVEARKSTLLYIVKQYPSSRFAARATQDLEALGVKVERAATP